MIPIRCILGQHGKLELIVAWSLPRYNRLLQGGGCRDLPPMYRAAFMCRDCGKTIELDMPDHEQETNDKRLLDLLVTRGAVGNAK